MLFYCKIYQIVKIAVGYLEQQNHFNHSIACCDVKKLMSCSNCLVLMTNRVGWVEEFQEIHLLEIMMIQARHGKF